jgi:hypothetical protein
MFSVYDGDRGGITSGILPEGSRLPVHGMFKQVFPGSNVRSVFENHRQAVFFLKGHGILCKATNAQDFEREFCSSILRMRKSFLASPLMFTWTVLWRVAAKKSPYIGPIQTQPGIFRQLQQVMAGGSKR